MEMWNFAPIPSNGHFALCRIRSRGTKTEIISSKKLTSYLFKVPLRRLPSSNREFKIQRSNSKENIPQKVNFRSFSLYSDYSYPLTLSNVGEPS